MKKIKIKIDNHNLNNENFKELLRSGQIEFSENADIILSCNEEKTLSHRFVPSSIRKAVEIHVDMTDGTTLGKQKELLTEALSEQPWV